MIKTLNRYFRNTTGQSLAEFAVITAMMATFIATASGKFSNVMEGGKVRKTEEGMDKLLQQAQDYYQKAVVREGRGRYPGQDRFDLAVGDFETELDLISSLETFEYYNNEDGEKWRSIFGIANEEAPMPEGANFINDTVMPDEECKGCSEDRLEGHTDWLFSFGGNAIVSPFQDGHYIYAVIAGSGTGESTVRPILYIADAESPQFLHKMLEF